MSQASPFSVLRELSDGTFAQLPGSVSGSGLSMASGAYRAGSNVFSVCIDTGLTVTPTKTSPLRISWSCIRPQPRLRSNRFDGFSGSTTTLPLKSAAFAGRRTRILVVYGAFAVRTTAGPGAGQV